MTSFLGIDLAWQSDKNHTGAAVLRGDQSGLTVHELSSGLRTLADVEAFIHRNASADTVVAIDAPLVIVNKDRQRPCETTIGRRFGAAHASAHSSNLQSYPDAASVRLASNLQSHGFRHCPEPHHPFLTGKWFFEVYPHPAHVVLFQRTRIIKYKKGTVANRRAGLLEFRATLKGYLTGSTPAVHNNNLLTEFLSQSLDDVRGEALKHYEDTLDALFCAYLAAHFWTWSYARNEMIGDRTSGYIINPK